MRWLLLLLLWGLPAAVQAQLTFPTNNGSITITGYTGTNGMVVIPDTMSDYPVASIGGAGVLLPLRPGQSHDCPRSLP